MNKTIQTTEMEIIRRLQYFGHDILWICLNRHVELRSVAYKVAYEGMLISEAVSLF